MDNIPLREKYIIYLMKKRYVFVFKKVETEIYKFLRIYFFTTLKILKSIYNILLLPLCHHRIILSCCWHGRLVSGTRVFQKSPASSSPRPCTLPSTFLMRNISYWTYCFIEWPTLGGGCNASWHNDIALLQLLQLAASSYTMKECRYIPASLWDYKNISCVSVCYPVLISIFYC